MTASQNKQATMTPAEAVSTSPLLPFTPEDLVRGLRVNQADFARMCKVSRQTVSKWVRTGKIQSVFPDGTMDPRQAAREVIRNTDPARLRAKVFRVATEDSAALRRRMADLEGELRLWKEKAAYQEECLGAFRGVLEERTRFIFEAGPEKFGTNLSLAMEYAEWLLSEGGGDDEPAPEETEFDAERAEGDVCPLPLFDETDEQ